MKKFITLALALGLVGVFTACSNDEAAEKETETAVAAESTGELTLGRVNNSPHGDKSFATTVVVMDGDKIALASIDEFQFLADDAKGVPNSDGPFGESYPEGKVLGSKMDNAEYYSKMMAEKGGSTVSIDANVEAIQNYVVGKTIAELEAELKANEATPEKMVDVVSGATLADTYGYVKAFVEAAKAAK
ncbi:hypothetical protein [Bacillus tuaregi]|uniref:hypothetical protein n=1 Tax=Bacillus tuaregi TaxID=1816695 RepID=UPI0008F96806|nr:hypothetical protein [Bacillus tuaregi]